MCATYCVLPVSIVESIVVSIVRPLCVHHASIMSLYFYFDQACMFLHSTYPVAVIMLHFPRLHINEQQYSSDCWWKKPCTTSEQSTFSELAQPPLATPRLNIAMGSSRDIKTKIYSRYLRVRTNQC